MVHHGQKKAKGVGVNPLYFHPQNLDWILNNKFEIDLPKALRSGNAYKYSMHFPDEHLS